MPSEVTLTPLQLRFTPLDGRPRAPIEVVPEGPVSHSQAWEKERAFIAERAKVQYWVKSALGPERNSTRGTHLIGSQ